MFLMRYSFKKLKMKKNNKKKLKNDIKKVKNILVFDASVSVTLLGRRHKNFQGRKTECA